MSSNVVGYVSMVPQVDLSCPAFNFTNNTAPSLIPYQAETATNYAINQCTYTNYNLENITSEDLETWNNNFIYGYAALSDQGKHVLNTILLPNYCNGSTTNCPSDPYTMAPMKSCSRFLDTQNPVCGLWAVDHPDVADNVKEQWCYVNSDISGSTYNGPVECECITRQYNPVYQALNTGDPNEDHCWFIPCANPSFFLSLNDSNYTECPDICGVIVKNYNEEAEIIGLEEAIKYVNCNLEEPATNVLLTMTSSVSKTVSSEDWWYWIILSLILIFVIILCIVFGIYMKRLSKIS